MHPRIPLAAVAALLALYPASARAQPDERGLGRLLRECRTLADMSARTACYDAIVLDEGAQPERPAPERRASADFGSNQLPRSASAEAPAPAQLSASVTRTVEREPGIYLLTLADGTQWQFVDAAPAAYDPPRAGATIEISRASMGSYLIRYAGQRSVRARRIR